MGRIPKWFVVFGIIVIIVVLGVFGYFYFFQKTAFKGGEITRIFVKPTETTDPYSIQSSDKEAPTLLSKSREISGIIVKGCDTDYLSISYNGINYQFKVSEAVVNMLLNKDVTANILPTDTKNGCGTEAKLGSVLDKQNNLYVLGKKACLPLPESDVAKGEEGSCYAAIQSLAEDYYIVNRPLYDYLSSITENSLVIASGSPDTLSSWAYPGLKGKMKVTKVELITQNEN